MALPHFDMKPGMIASKISNETSRESLDVGLPRYIEQKCDGLHENQGGRSKMKCNDARPIEGSQFCASPRLSASQT